MPDEATPWRKYQQQAPDQQQGPWTKYQAPTKPAESGSTLGNLWQGLVRGAASAVYGMGQLGEHIPSLPMTAGAAAGAKRVSEGAAKSEQESEAKYQASPAAKSWAGLIGRVGGEVAATAPLAAIPGLGAARGASLGS